MADWESALKAIGGAAAIGGLIDLCLYKAEKKNLQNWLETWWLHFTEVKWSNFGRAEAELAVQILDRWTGPRLWSWKRWRFSASVTSAVYVLVFLWTSARLLGHYEMVQALSWEKVLDFVKYIPPVLFFAIPWVAGLAASLSLTRLIAVCAARLCRGILSNFVMFFSLLILHVILLFFWTPIAVFFVVLPMWAAWVLIAACIGGPDFSLADILQAFFAYVGKLWEYNSPHWGVLFNLWPAAFPNHKLLTGLYFADVAFDSFGTAMDLIANGVRILFALVFLSSFVFRPLIQEPVSRVWYGAMNSGKPFFTMAFGAGGTLVAVGQALVR